MGMRAHSSGVLEGEKVLLYGPGVGERFTLKKASLMTMQVKRKEKILD